MLRRQSRGASPPTHEAPPLEDLTGAANDVGQPTDGAHDVVGRRRTLGDDVDIVGGEVAADEGDDVGDDLVPGAIAVEHRRVEGRDGDGSAEGGGDGGAVAHRVVVARGELHPIEVEEDDVVTVGADRLTQGTPLGGGRRIEEHVAVEPGLRAGRSAAEGKAETDGEQEG